MAEVPTSLSGFQPQTQSDTSCSSLLCELQIMWDEIGEHDNDRDKMLLQLEQECFDIYRRKVEKTRRHKAELRQSLADSEAEIVKLSSTLGECVSFSRVNGSLKEQLSALRPTLEELNLKKKERTKEFLDTQSLIAKLSAEIAGNTESIKFENIHVNEHDLTSKKLGELKAHLQELQNEKLFRLQKVNSHINTIHRLSVVMSFDFFETVNQIHPSLTDQTNKQLKSISNDTLARLTSVIHTLQQDKQQRLKKLQTLGDTLMDLWNFLDIPPEERKRFQSATSLMSATVDEVSEQGSLAQSIIEQAMVEVERLNVLKARKMKELVFQKQTELEEIYRDVHMEVDGDAAREILVGLIDSGNVALPDILSSLDDQIAKAKEQAFSRKDILDKVEKWRHASEEEKWLDEYEKDENRYSAGRGVHKNLKRAEKARILVNKMPALLENLTSKVKAWESDRGIPFLYDKTPLLRMLVDYSTSRQEREEEKKRSREQKRLQEQLAVEKEAIYGTRPAIKKPLGQTNTNNLIGTPIARRGSTPGHHGISSGKERRESGRTHSVIPINYVALPKEDMSSR